VFIYKASARWSEGRQQSSIIKLRMGWPIYVLGVPAEYLEAVCKGIPVEATAALKFCPNYWGPGTAPDPLWINIRSKYCCACATELRSHCSGCNEAITSLKHRFCPYCGKAYKSAQAGNKNS